MAEDAVLLLEKQVSDPKSKLYTSTKILKAVNSVRSLSDGKLIKRFRLFSGIAKAALGIVGGVGGLLASGVKSGFAALSHKQANSETKSTTASVEEDMTTSKSVKTATSNDINSAVEKVQESKTTNKADAAESNKK